MGYEIDTGVISQEDEFIGHGDYQCMMEMVHLENENVKLKDQLEQSEVDRKSATLQCESMRKDQNTLSAVEKENKRLRELFRRYIDMWLDNEGVHFFDCMSKEDEKKLIEIREGGK